jgi:hypothetical protein
MTALTYVAGLAYERLVNSVAPLSPFRVVMIGQLAKPAICTKDDEHRAFSQASRN